MAWRSARIRRSASGMRRWKAATTAWFMPEPPPPRSKNWAMSIWSSSARNCPIIASDQHIFQTARKLGWNVLGFVAKIEAVDFDAKTIRVRRMTEQGTADRCQPPARRDQRAKGHQRAEIPDLHRHPQSSQGGNSRLGCSRSRPETRRLSTPKHQARSATRNLPKREGIVEMIDGAIRAGESGESWSKS